MLHRWHIRSISMEIVPRYAAIDIGSNSIRMEAAEVTPGQPARILASDREVTRLGESVFRTGSVSKEAIDASCAVLARMAEGYRKLDVIGVRAVATSAIRDARNQGEFQARASQAAGTRVEIISGREEARLIHLGVESNWPQGDKATLVLDIGERRLRVEKENFVKFEKALVVGGSAQTATNVVLEYRVPVKLAAVEASSS